VDVETDALRVLESETDVGDPDTDTLGEAEVVELDDPDTGELTEPRSRRSQRVSRAGCCGLPVGGQTRLHRCNIAVRIEAVEESDFGLDGCIRKVTTSPGEVTVGERLGSVSWLHWVDEGGLLVVAQVRQSGDIECSHHILLARVSVGS
jgi:hypothetical protein